MTGPSSADERDLLRRLLALSERGTAAIQQILAVLHASNAEIAALRQRARPLAQQGRGRPGAEIAALRERALAARTAGPRPARL